MTAVEVNLLPWARNEHKISKRLSLQMKRSEKQRNVVVLSQDVAEDISRQLFPTIQKAISLYQPRSSFHTDVERPSSVRQAL